MSIQIALPSLRRLAPLPLLALAETPLPNTPTYKFQGRIDSVTTGASFRTLRNAGTASDACAVGTTATSAAVSGVPAGATIRKALLSWAASADRTDKTNTGTGTVINDTAVTFDGQTVTGGTQYTDIVPVGSPVSGYNFGNVADVTAQIAALANPNKTCAMTGLTILNANVGTLSTTTPVQASNHCAVATALGGLGLYIVCEAPSETYKNMVIYEGFGRSQNELLTRTLNGIMVPNVDEAKTSVLTWEGDETLNNNATGIAESLSFGAGQAASAITHTFNLGGTGTTARSGIFNSTDRRHGLLGSCQRCSLALAEFGTHSRVLPTPTPQPISPRPNLAPSWRPSSMSPLPGRQRLSAPRPALHRVSRFRRRQHALLAARCFAEQIDQSVLRRRSVGLCVLTQGGS